MLIMHIPQGTRHEGNTELSFPISLEQSSSLRNFIATDSANTTSNSKFPVQVESEVAAIGTIVALTGLIIALTALIKVIKS